MNCSLSTYRQYHLADVSGIGGFCIQNNTYQPAWGRIRRLRLRALSLLNETPTEPFAGFSHQTKPPLSPMIHLETILFDYFARTRRRLRQRFSWKIPEAAQFNFERGEG